MATPHDLCSRATGSVLLALACLCGAGCGGGARRPNVVVIVIDTLRADYTSLQGHDRETTPQIDAWARGGTVFDRAWSMSSWTKPSVAMLFTGRASVDNSGTIATDEAYFPDYFRAEGYRTGAVIANPLFAGIDGKEADFARGFERYEAYDMKRDGLGRNSWPSREVTRRGIDFLEENEDEPFFLYLMYFDPHDPYRPEDPSTFLPRDDPERRRALEAALLPEHEGQLTDEIYAGIEKRRALYEAEVRQADLGVGAFLAELEARGLADETLVVLTSDHGEGLWQRPKLEGENDKDHAYFPQLYFDHGVMLYSEQVHVPLVLRGPGVAPGKRRAEDVSLLDVLPSALGLSGLRVPGDLEGSNLFDPDYEGRDEVMSVCSRGTTVTLGGRMRLHEPRDYRIEKFGAEPELYDLIADPLELEPLDDPDRIAAMQRYVALWRERHASRRAPASRSDAEIELLHQLGYFGEAELVPNEEEEPR